MLMFILPTPLYNLWLGKKLKLVIIGDSRCSSPVWLFMKILTIMLKYSYLDIFLLMDLKENERK